LLDLATVAAGGRGYVPHPARVQTVSLAHICGSEGRVRDFDRAFHPLQAHTRERWLSIALAWQQGRELPVVELI
jgi:hypothetical protein